MARTVIDPPSGYPPAPGYPAPGQTPPGHPPGHAAGYPPGYPSPQGFPPGYSPPGYSPPGHPPPGYPPAGAPGYPPGPSAPRPPGTSAKKVAAIVGASLGGLTLIGLIVYFAFFHYTPVALQHVPAGTTIAVRVDLVDAATFGPVRRNLTPLVDEATPGAVATGGKSRTERVGDAVGFAPDRDLRELVVCFLGGDDRVAVLVGGNIPKGKLVPGLKKVADEERSTAWTQSGDILKSSTMVVGQASDGTAVIASDEATLRAALGESSLGTQMGLSSEAAVSYAIAGDVWKRLATGIFGSMLTSLQNLRTLDASAGTMTLSDAPKLETRVRLSAGASAEEAKASLYRVFTDLRRLSELRRKITGSSLDLTGEEQALAQSTIETRGTDSLRVVTPWPYDGLDRGSRELATKLRAMRALLGQPPVTVQPPGNLVLPGGIPLPIPIPGFQ